MVTKVEQVKQTEQENEEEYTPKYSNKTLIGCCLNILDHNTQAFVEANIHGFMGFLCFVTLTIWTILEIIASICVYSFWGIKYRNVYKEPHVDTLDYKKVVNLHKPLSGEEACVRMYDNVNSNIDLAKNDKDMYSEERFEIKQASSLIRKALLKSATLYGIIIDTKYMKTDDGELMQFLSTGELNQPFMKQYISFGTDMNNALKQMLGDKVTITTRKKGADSCIIIENGDLNPIKNELSKVFCVPEVKICLTEG